MERGKISLFLKNIYNILFYGGVSKDKYARVKEDIFNYNRKVILIYAAFTGFFFIILTGYSFLFESVIAKNRYMYLLGAVTLVMLFIFNKFLAKKYHLILEISKYIAVISLFAFGIVLAINSADDVTATYMVLLFAVPLILMIKPVTMTALTIVSNVVYIYLMSRLQQQELLLKNLVNANIYAIVSIVTGTSMFIMKIQKYETDYMNRKLMKLDQLTGLLNRHAYNEVINAYSTKEMEDNLLYVSMDINGLKKVNDTFGHRAGDNLITSAASCMRKAFNKYGDIFRVGGDEFVAVLYATKQELEEAISSFNRLIELHNQQDNDNLSISIGYSTIHELEKVSFEELAHSADVKMYKDKSDYYTQTGKDRRL